MAKYSSKKALSELKYLESLIMLKAENLLKNKDSRGVAELLISIDNQIHHTEREAIRLRLTGKLDYEVYRTLIDGYFDLQRKIVEFSDKYGLGRDVKDMYSFLRVEASMANRKVKI
ncbi:MAG: hypothetical protein QW779_04960 [Nitrososphaerales archaeon]